MNIHICQLPIFENMIPHFDDRVDLENFCLLNKRIYTLRRNCDWLFRDLFNCKNV